MVSGYITKRDHICGHEDGLHNEIKDTGDQEHVACSNKHNRHGGSVSDVFDARKNHAKATEKHL